MSPMLKNLFTVFTLVVVLGGGYYFYASMGEGVEGVPLDSNITQETEQILNNISRVQGYKMDDSVLSDKRFISLKNIRVELPTIESGRSDPFAAVE